MAPISIEINGYTHTANAGEKNVYKTGDTALIKLEGKREGGKATILERIGEHPDRVSIVTGLILDKDTSYTKDIIYRKDNKETTIKAVFTGK